MFRTSCLRSFAIIASVQTAVRCAALMVAVLLLCWHCRRRKTRFRPFAIRQRALTGALASNGAKRLPRNRSAGRPYRFGVAVSLRSSCAYRWGSAYGRNSWSLTIQTSTEIRRRTRQIALNRASAFESDVTGDRTMLRQFGLGPLAKTSTTRLARIAPRASLSAVAILTLAIAIAANTTVFSWLDAVLLRPLPGIPESERLVALSRARFVPEHGLLRLPRSQRQPETGNGHRRQHAAHRIPTRRFGQSATRLGRTRIRQLLSSAGSSSRGGPRFFAARVRRKGPCRRHQLPPVAGPVPRRSVHRGQDDSRQPARPDRCWRGAARIWGLPERSRIRYLGPYHARSSVEADRRGAL